MSETVDESTTDGGTSTDDGSSTDTGTSTDDGTSTDTGTSTDGGTTSPDGSTTADESPAGTQDPGTGGSAGAASGAQGGAAPSQDDYANAFAAVTPDINDSQVAVIEAPQGEEAIAGEGSDVVNAGVQLIKMVANSSSVTMTQDGYAAALPAGVAAADLAGWQPNKRVISFTSGKTPWWEIWHADWSVDVLVTFMYGGNAGGTGAYVDQAHVALDNVTLPADFSFEAEAAFPAAGLRLTPPTVGGIQLTLTLRLKGFFGHLLSAERSMVMLLIGTGEIRDI